jgi:hypothetical protein
MLTPCGENGAADSAAQVDVARKIGGDKSAMACQIQQHSGRPGRTAFYRENFLYLMRFGITESSPSRRILSFS